MHSSWRKKSSAIGTWKTPYRSRSIIIILTLSRYKNRIINSKQEEKNSLHISIYFSSIRTDFQASQIQFYSIIFSYLIENLILCFDLFIDFMFHFPWQNFLSDLENLVEVFFAVCLKMAFRFHLVLLQKFERAEVERNEESFEN